MTVLDIIFLIFFCWFGFLGFKNGLIYEITTLTALILGIWVAYHFSDNVISLFTDSTLAQPIAFILTFAIVLLLVHLLGHFLQQIVRLAIPAFIDHLFGLLFGAGKVLVVASVLLYFIQDIDRREILLTKEAKTKSVTYKYVEPVVPRAMDWKEQYDSIQKIDNQYD